MKNVGVNGEWKLKASKTLRRCCERAQAADATVLKDSKIQIKFLSISVVLVEEHFLKMSRILAKSLNSYLIKDANIQLAV